MGTLRPVEEVEVDPQRRPVLGEADGQAAPHLVGIEGLVARLARHPPGGLTRVGSHPDLGDHPDGLHRRRPGLVGVLGELLGDTEGVGLEAASLVPGGDLGHNAVGPDGARLRHLGLHDHQVVELQVVGLPDQNPELRGRGRLQAQHQSHLLQLVVKHRRAPGPGPPPSGYDGA